MTKALRLSIYKKLEFLLSRMSVGQPYCVGGSVHTWDTEEVEAWMRSLLNEHADTKLYSGWMKNANDIYNITRKKT